MAARRALRVRSIDDRPTQAFQYFGAGHRQQYCRATQTTDRHWIVDPVTLGPDALVADALELMAKYKISGVPITDGDQRLVGILTNRDLRFHDDVGERIAEVMTREGLVTAPVGTTLEEAQAILGRHRIEKLPVVDADGRLSGLITVKDFVKREQYPQATKDVDGRLVVGAAVGVGEDAHLRAMALANLHIRDEWIIPDMLDNTNYLTEFSFPDPLPTAFVCNNDILACQFARALENHGVRVPEDVSITGFDDYIYGPDTRPITTYAVDQQRMAQVTVRRLQNRIREGMEGPLRTSVGGWFVERDSVMDLHTGKRCGRMEKD